MEGNVVKFFINIKDGLNHTNINPDSISLTLNETSIVVGEIYRHIGRWRFGAVGSGFDDGLISVCKHYGIKNIK